MTLLGGLLPCQEHDYTCYGGSAGATGTYVASVPGQCFVSMSRKAADAAVSLVVIERLRRPDAAELFRPHVDGAGVDREIADLRHRREEIADLVADGLLTAAAARPRLLGLLERLQALELARSPTPMQEEALVDPAAAWDAWTVTQQRELLRLLFRSISLRHVGHRNGPRADPSRLTFEWATDPAEP